MARVGEREFVVNAEVEDGGDKDNRLLRQPGKPLNQEADLSTRVLSRPKERKKKNDLQKRTKPRPLLKSTKYFIVSVSISHVGC